MDYLNFFRDKKILVTGVAGTVGAALAEKLTEFNPASLAGLDNNESGLYMISQKLGLGFDPVLGDLRDRDKLISAFKGVDIVFHAAALKHVPLCEHHPMEAVQTNILGVQNVIHAALANGVSRVIYTSTDKAVNPPNVMGASKLMGEQLMRAANMSARGQIFTSTRFGNVLGSRGSVLPIFTQQIREGGPVTLTSREMSRFVMTLQESVSLLLEAAMLAKGGDIFITKMSTAKIVDLAHVMVDVVAPGCGRNPDSIEIREVGLRPGEKLYEELMNVEEMRRSLELKRHFVVMPALYDMYSINADVYPGVLRDKVDKPYNSSNELAMTRGELRDYLINTGLIG